MCSYNFHYSETLHQVVLVCLLCQVREQELHKALRCLSGKFRIVSDSDTWQDKSLVESVQTNTLYPHPTSQLKCKKTYSVLVGHTHERKCGLSA